MPESTTNDHTETGNRRKKTADSILTSEVVPGILTSEDIEAVIETRHRDPFQVLGMHKIKDGRRTRIMVRAFIPDSVDMFVINKSSGLATRMTNLHPDGFFEAVCDEMEVFPYMLQSVYSNGMVTQFHDSYSFLPLFTEFDLHLIGEGNHHRLFEKLGSHFKIVNGIGGIHFAVWAPNASRVSVIGDFNMWDGRKHVMRCLGTSGVFEIFIPGLGMKESYKYEVRSHDGALQEKTDPFGRRFEVRPRTGTITYDIEGYEWQDEEWMTARAADTHLEKPMSVYEVHLGSFMRVVEEGNRFLTYREMAERFVAYVKDMGYTHVEFLPVLEHPYDLSWGYQVTGYYAPTSRHGSPKAFMHLVDTLHKENIGVILDWVPAHFPKDWHGLGSFDGTHLFEHADPRQGEHKDWDTYIFNFGRNEVRNFLISNALFWCEKYHIDGLRVDAVASMLYLDYSRKADEWVPNRYGGRENLEAIEFLKYLNAVIHQYHPGVVTIAEESTAWPRVTGSLEEGGLGFDYKWNMGWMHDTLDYFASDPLYRKFNHKNVTFPLLYAWSENYCNVFSHDEVVHMKGSMIRKMPGDVWERFANLRLLYAYMYTMPGKKLLFMGADMAQWNEWNCNQSLDWNLLDYESHRKLNDYVRYLNQIYRDEKSLHEKDHSPDGFRWIRFDDSDTGVISYLRFANDPKDHLVCVMNMTPVTRYNYRVGVPEHRPYRELLNSDAEMFWGSNVGNYGGYWSDPIPKDGQHSSLNMTLPPLSALVFKPA